MQDGVSDQVCPVLAVASLTKRYGRFTAVHAVNISVQPGEIVGLLGPNGSGKSTVLHCVTGVVVPTSGKITIGGVPHHTTAAKAAFGFVPDDLAMPTNLTGAEFLDLIRRLQPGADADLVTEFVTLLGLDSAMGKLVAEYSHGMKRKVQMIAALSHRPVLLILDEPFSGLDPEAHVILRTLIDSFVSGGGGVLLATHDLAAAEAYCDRVSIVSTGEVVAAGNPRHLIVSHGKASLEEVFLAATGIEERTHQVRERISEIELHVNRARISAKVVD